MSIANLSPLWLMVSVTPRLPNRNEWIEDAC